jgi:Rhamnan synthesis protein F
MALPPLWKVRRELLRIREKTSRAAGRWIYDPIRKPLYDLTTHWWHRVTQGSHPLTDRVAVFMIYQPKGIAPSILLTLEHLRQNHYSVLIVSNGALRPEDRSKLAKHAALVLERPNVGYDFGAYRDGIRHLWSLKHDMSRLILMNDSTWFPLRRDDDSLARMEALDADLAGHIFKTENEEKRANDHVESHLLMISRDFLRSKDFRQFWSRYKMSDLRRTTIALGEKGFSQLAICSGRRVRTLMGREWLLSVLHQLDERDLRFVLDHTIDSFTRHEKDAAHVRRLAASGAPWRDAYLDWTDTSLRNSLSFLLSAAFVMPALVYGRMGFAKKANDIRFHLAREELLDLEASGLIPRIDDVVRAEIKQSLRSWDPPKGQDKMVRPKRAVS